MHGYKVGDKIRVLAADDSNHYLVLGSIATVEDLGKDFLEVEGTSRTHSGIISQVVYPSEVAPEALEYLRSKNIEADVPISDEEN